MRGRADPDDRRVEIPEAVLGDPRGDLGAEAAELDGLVRDDEVRRLGDRRGDRLGVERDERPRVEHLDADPLRLELARGPKRLRDERTECDDGHVCALARHACLAELDRVALLRHRCRLVEEEQLLLEEDHRVVVLDRDSEQPLRVVRVGGHRDDEPRDVREERLEALRVLRAEPHAAAGDHPQDERQIRRAAHHEPELRGLVEDLVERDAGEVGELELDDRS
jgi:hypothetical protein